MTDDRAKVADAVRYVAAREFAHPMPTSLAACSVELDVEAKAVRLLAHFDTPPTDDEKDEVRYVDSQIQSVIPDNWYSDTEFEVVGTGSRPNILRDGLLYERTDSQ